MKKTVLCLLLTLAVPAIAKAQLLIDDFETEAHTWNNVSCYTEVRATDYIPTAGNHTLRVELLKGSMNYYAITQ